MKPDIKWVNKSKPRKTMSPITHKEDLVFPAHSNEAVGFSPYVSKASYDRAIAALKSPDLIPQTLKDLGEL